MKTLPTILFCALMLVCPSILQPADLTILPSERVIGPFTANQREHRMSLVKMLDENMYAGSLGAIVPLAEVAYDGAARRVQILLAGTFYTNLSAAEHQFVVTNGDYYVDVLADIRLAPAWALRAGIGHTSQHLMDDAFEVRKMGHSINYVRDYIELFAVKDVEGLGGFVYAGFFYNYTFIIDTHRDGTMIYEAGLEALNYPIAPGLFVYCGADIKWRGESSFATTQNYQLGLKLAASGSTTRAVRAAINYQTGLDERGQFTGTRASRASIGLYFDF
ncbi:MAG: DUF1207 domain-containing protein [Acidobacteriota bacterium]